jgi:hypothetical protein
MGIADPIRVAELVMAAPDVDRDYFNLHAPELRKLTSGMTLYASSNDKAITVSRTLAGGIPRAGDVPAAGPVVIPGIETIDVSVVGNDLLGLNHDVFASTRQVMNDNRTAPKLNTPKVASPAPGGDLRNARGRDKSSILALWPMRVRSHGTFWTSGELTRADVPSGGIGEKQLVAIIAKLGEPFRAPAIEIWDRASRGGARAGL